MQKPVPGVVTRKLRGRYMLAGAVMLSLWGACLVAVFQDGSSFNIIATIFATLTFLPLALAALWGGISGSGAAMQRAHYALLTSGGLLLLVAATEVFRRIFLHGN